MKRTILQVMLMAGLIVATTAPGADLPGRSRNREAARKATFAGGCFWCMQPPFEKLAGVISVKAGYSGGRKRSPTYRGGVRRRHGASRIGGDRVRPVEDHLRAASRRLLAQRRPHRQQPTVLRSRPASTGRRSSTTTRPSGVWQRRRRARWKRDVAGGSSPRSSLCANTASNSSWMARSCTHGANFEFGETFFRSITPFSDALPAQGIRTILPNVLDSRDCMVGCGGLSQGKFPAHHRPEGMVDKPRGKSGVHAGQLLFGGIIEGHAENGGFLPHGVPRIDLHRAAAADHHHPALLGQHLEVVPEVDVGEHLAGRRPRPGRRPVHRNGLQVARHRGGSGTQWRALGP